MKMKLGMFVMMTVSMTKGYKMVAVTPPRITIPKKAAVEIPRVGQVMDGMGSEI